MRAVIQRVHSAKVTVAGEIVGAIARGLLVYLGAAKDDAEADLAYTVGKITGLRVFPDDAGRMTHAVTDIRGGILVVSQFTLFGDVRRGRRPSFDGAAEPAIAERLYEDVVARLRASGLEIQTGRFRADMRVSSEGDGPVTVLVDSRRLF